MKLSDLPTRQPVPFATSGTKNAIPATQPAGSPGRASYSGGFPNETMQPIAAGGTPPFGQDFNGLFFDVTNELRWAQSGGTYTYDSTFATAIGGYPSGAVLKSTLANVLWINTADDNTTDPDGGSAANWVAFRPNSGRANLAVVSGDLTPTAAQKLSQVLSVTGVATGLTTTLRLPLAAGTSYLINNATTGSGATLNVQGATGTGVTVGQGQATVVFTDGTNYYAAGASGGPYLPADGTAVAATKLATARAFNLSGVITASAVNFDGTGNVTLATAIADGALSIAKTNGLQTALDGKLSTGGGSLTGSLATVGITFGSTLASAPNDLTKHLSLFGTVYGFSITSGTLNSVATNGVFKWYAGVSGTTLVATLSGSGALSLPSSVNCVGITMGSNLAASATDLSKHIDLYGGILGFSVTAGHLNYVVNSASNHNWFTGTANTMTLTTGGNLVVTGTGNFQGSDVRFKRDIKRSAPRPIHRGLSLCDYTMIASGEAGRGVLAQELLLKAKEYVQEVEFRNEGKAPQKRLTVNYAGSALEMAMWAANEVDHIKASRRREARLLSIALVIAAFLAARVL